MRAAQDQAVLVVDIQADFTEYRSGSLAVPGTDQRYLEKVVARTRQYRAQGLPIIATRDHHPADHLSFFTNHEGAKFLDVIQVEDRKQILWPPHCVQATPGADLLLPAELITAIVSKGEHRKYDSYSAFRDDGGYETGLKERLEELGVKGIIIYGLTTDFCVRFTVLHALEAGFPATVLLELCRGVTPEGTRSAIDEMRSAGATIID
jgi:nicotinamidase/pyrazinamidase